MRILLNSPYRLTPEQGAILRAVVPGLDLVDQPTQPADQLSGAGVSVLVTEQVPRNLAAWPDLRWVQLLSAGANQLFGHPVRDTAIQVTTASGTHGVPIAQYVTCAALMMVHRMPDLLPFKSNRVWPNRLALAGTTLRGMTVGIIGYGSIGRECARQLSALGLRVLCLKRNPSSRVDTGYNAWPDTGDPEGRIPEAWYGPDDLSQLLPQCDLLVVTVPSTPQTDGLIGAAQFAQMKRGARLVLVSRGGIVDETALAEALRQGQLAGATVDCFVREPTTPDLPLFDVPNLIMTPHMSGVYTGFWPAMVGLLAENLRRFSSGHSLLNLTLRADGY
ncbi:MAG: D-2-hydroxyacid dehydrogenase [Opitutaceae bacterium]